MKKLTDLYAAIWSGDVARISRLVGGKSGGGELSSKGNLLHKAVDADQPAVVEWALRNGFQPCSADETGKTPLAWAIRLNHIECARRLLDAGAHKCSADVGRGFRAIHWAAFSGSIEMCSLLCSYGEISGVTPEDGNAANIAASQGRTEILELLIANGVSVNVAESDGVQPIHWAAVNNLPEMIRLIHSSGGDIEARTDMGRTPFYVATMLDKASAARCLLSLGANMNIVDVDGKTAKWWADGMKYSDLADIWNGPAT